MDDEMNPDTSFTDPATEKKEKLATLDIVSVNKSQIFSKEQCLKILENCIEELWLPTKVVGSGDLHQAKRQKLRGDLQDFPFMDIRAVTKGANEEIYDFNLLGIIDQDFPQIFKYDAKDYYNWHIDLNPMAPSRKLSFIINLSSPEDYSGGDLEFLNIDSNGYGLNDLGACMVFPSYTTWRISPLTSGTKLIIVGHVHGALFK